MCRPRSSSISNAIALVVLLALAGCATEPTPPRAARVVIITDTHVIGPQYTTPVENTPADNESILLAPARLIALRDRVNALRPLPDAVIVLGDVVHAAHHSTDLAWYDANRNAYTVAKEIFDGFAMPVHVLMGNHDYEYDCDDTTYSKALSEELFRRFFGAEPWYRVEYGGVGFYLLNGQQGPTWDSADPTCDTYFASFGAEQLGWLDEQLADGHPSVVMSHYMGLLWKQGENAADSARADLETVIGGHPNATMVLAGHTHRWLDFSGLYTHEHYVVGPSRYDDDNFWVLDLNGPKGTIFISDREKAIPSSSCAETYDYSVDPSVAEAGAVEHGTCVVGLE